MSLEKKIVLTLAIYCSFGAYGALWISDQFDAERTLLYGFFAIPAAIICCSTWILEPFYVLRSKFFIRFIVGLFLVIFAWGNLLLVNALMTGEPEKVGVVYKDLEKDRAFNLAMKRGGLGLLYRTRW